MIDFYLKNETNQRTNPRFDRELLEKVRKGVYEEDDLSCALQLLRELTHHWNKKIHPLAIFNLQVPTEDLNDAQMALEYLLDRLGVVDKIPWVDVSDMTSQCKQHSQVHDVQVQYLTKAVSSLREELIRRDQERIKKQLAYPLEEIQITEWDEVDEWIAEMRRGFAYADKTPIFSTVGNLAIQILQETGEVLYKKTQSLGYEIPTDPNAEKALGNYEKPKNRVEWFLETTHSKATGKNFHALFGEVLDLAHKVKHRPRETTPEEVAYVGDCTILLVTVMKRLTVQAEK